jgi:hypothetical protein
MFSCVSTKSRIGTVHTPPILEKMLFDNWTIIQYFTPEYQTLDNLTVCVKCILGMLS